MAAARTTLGSGVTRITKPASATTPATTRIARRAPHSAAPAKAMPTTSAQLAPDTAVRCDNDDVFMAASRSAVTALVSPTDRPGMSPDAGWGSPSTARASPRRSSDATARTPDAGVSTSMPREASITSTARSPGRAGKAVPCSMTVAPWSRPAVRTGLRICTGASTERATSPCPIARACASKRHPVALGSTLPVTRTVTVRARPPSMSTRSRSSRAACARLTCVATAAHAAKVIAAIASKGIATDVRGDDGERRARPATARSASDSTHDPPATHGATSGFIVVSIAVPHATTAIGIRRRSRLRTVRTLAVRTLTPARDPEATRASSRRCPERPADPPHS